MLGTLGDGLPCSSRRTCKEGIPGVGSAKCFQETGAQCSQDKVHSVQPVASDLVALCKCSPMECLVLEVHLRPLLLC
jgi:hypothetical protein